MTDDEIMAAAARSVAEAQSKARAYLIGKGLLLRRDSPVERLRRLAAWRDELPRTAKPDPAGAWGRVLDRYMAGEAVPLSIVKMAEQVTRRKAGPLLRVPNPRPPVPDARQISAGDVDYVRGEADALLTF